MRIISKLTVLCTAALAACLVDAAGSPPDMLNCGDGILDPDEECDDGAQNSDFGACLRNCQRARCGDGFIYPVFEQCDDGNQNTEDCEYGRGPCIVCDASCQKVFGKTASCGNGITDPGEICDDGNLSCGSCNDTCQNYAWRPGIGFIDACSGSELAASGTKTFTLDDGVDSVTFEFVVDEANLSSVLQTPAMMFISSPIVIGVYDSSSEEDVAEKIGNSINELFQAGLLSISATVSGSYVNLTQLSAPPGGYKMIVNNVASYSFSTNGMHGYRGRDCGFGAVCTSNEDCQTGPCEHGRCPKAEGGGGSGGGLR